MVRARQVFQEVVDLQSAERGAWLEAACADDQTLLDAVRELVEADRASDGDAGLIPDFARVLAMQDRDLSGTTLGSYRLLEKVGQGGMGVVYRAERTDAPGHVAIKVMRQATVMRPETARARFYAEQQVHAPLVHRAIPQLHGYGTTPEGAPYLVFEYVEGGVELTKYCAQREAPLAERLRLFRDVCEAVQYAHGRAVIHRDLKPSNILVKPDATVHLLDFGIAKQLESLKDVAVQTQGDARAFTPAYAAPEQHRGEALGVFTDVYALGVVLYELLAQQHPINCSGLTAGQIAAIACERDPERLSIVAGKSGSSEKLGRVSRAEWADLDRLVGKAMARAPEQRYGSVVELVRDLDHFRRGEPLEARPPSLGYRTSKFIRRNRWRLGVGALTAIVLMGVVALYVIGRIRARDALIAESARTERVWRFMTGLLGGGDVQVGPRQGLRVEALLDRAVEARGLGRDPALQAELYATAGSLYTALGKLEQAARWLPRAMEIDQKTFGGSSRAVVRDLLALGRLRHEQGKDPEAEQLVKRALELARRVQPRDESFRVRAATLLGSVLNSTGRYKEAIAALDETFESGSRRGAMPEELSDLLGELANAHFYLGQYAESERLNLKRLSLDRPRLGEYHPHVADSLINLGAIATERGEYEKAERLNAQALTIYEKWYGNENPETASALTIWARSLLKLQRREEAEGALKRALASNEQVYGEQHDRVASTLNELGLAARERGNLDEAQGYAERMLKIVRALHKDKHPVVGVALANLATVYMRQGRYADAEGLFREALRVYAQTVPPGHQKIDIARITLGGCLLQEKRYADALGESRAAYESLRKRPSPPLDWLTRARTDLIAEYDALGQTENAAEIRAEIASAAK